MKGINNHLEALKKYLSVNTYCISHLSSNKGNTMAPQSELLHYNYYF